MSELSFLSPVPPTVVTEHPLAVRIDALDGKRLGLLDNRKANALGLLESVGRELTARHPGLQLAVEHKMASAGAPEDVLNRLRTCDAVILAIAD